MKVLRQGDVAVILRRDGEHVEVFMPPYGAPLDRGRFQFVLRALAIFGTSPECDRLRSIIDNVIEKAGQA